MSRAAQYSYRLDIAGAAALGAFVRSQVKRDYRNGQCDESANAAAIVFGAGPFRKGSEGIINLGGLIGLNSALRSIDRDQSVKSNHPTARASTGKNTHSNAEARNKPFTRKNVWRGYCEDGSSYGVDPKTFDSPDDYVEALAKAKAERSSEESFPKKEDSSDPKAENETSVNLYRGIWRKSCSDGTSYGLKPENFNSADDYEDAIEEARRCNSGEEK